MTGRVKEEPASDLTLKPMRVAPTAGNVGGSRFGKSPLCNGSRSWVPLRGGSELFQYPLDLPAAGVIKLQREGLAVVRDRAFILPDESERIGAAGKCRRDIGIEPDRFVEVLNGAIVALPSRVDEAAIAEGGGVVGIKPDGLIQILDCAFLVDPVGQICVEVPLRLLLVGEGPVDEGRRVFGVEPDRRVEVRDRGIEAAFPEIGKTSSVESGRVFGIKPNLFVVVLYGVIVIPEVQVGVAPVGVCGDQPLRRLPAGLDH